MGIHMVVSCWNLCIYILHVVMRSDDWLHTMCEPPENIFLSSLVLQVMVCHCKPPSDGRMGCGAKCLNRMLNIECVQGTCPCGDLCSNQQVQNYFYIFIGHFAGLSPCLQLTSNAYFYCSFKGENILN